MIEVFKFSVLKGVDSLDLFTGSISCR
jgi:hypothetical protein